jgi:hypothetical protein
MALQPIVVPDFINRLPCAEGAEQLIDTANDEIETTERLGGLLRSYRRAA